MNIHIIMAMQAEAKHIIDKLNLIKKDEFENVDVYHGTFESKNLHLFVNQKKERMDRIGTVHAALLTYKSIKYLKPNLILNMGTCGGITVNNIGVFDTICANDFIVYHDHFTGHDHGSIMQSLGFLKCIDQTANLTNFKHGVLASSNSFFLNPRSWSFIHKYKILGVDMEAAAVAEVAQDFGIPFTALKVVTDIVHEIELVDSIPQFEANFHPAMEILADKVCNALSKIKLTH